MVQKICVLGRWNLLPVSAAFRCRPVTSLGHQEGRRVFREGPIFFEPCPIFLFYVQHIFPGGAKHFLGGASPPLVTGLFRWWGPEAQALREAPCADTKCLGRRWSMKSLVFPHIINIYDVIFIKRHKTTNVLEKFSSDLTILLTDAKSRTVNEIFWKIPYRLIKKPLVVLVPSNTAPSLPNWNMKHYKLVEFLSNLNVKPPPPGRRQSPPTQT